MQVSQRAYVALREDILAWRLPPGAELQETEQAARLGVSRTPLREALSRLSAEGLAVPGRGRTLVVPQLHAADVHHLFELREALETQAVRLAARRRAAEPFERLLERLDDPALLGPGDTDRTGYYALVADLDAAVDEAVASPHLLRAITALRPHTARLRRLSRDNPARLAEAAREHRLIVQAVLDREETLAAQAMAVHLRSSLAAILANLAQSPTPNDPQHDPLHDPDSPQPTDPEEAA